MAHRKDSLVIRSRVEDATQAKSKELFLNVLEKVHAVRVAAKLTGIHYATLYRWRSADLDFAEAWDHAIAYSSEALESAAYLKLAEIYTDKRRKLDMPAERLTEFLLSGMMPAKYKQRNSFDVDITQLQITIDWTTIPDDIVKQFNANQLTLQDVYDWSLQHQETKEHHSSED